MNVFQEFENPLFYFEPNFEFLCLRWGLNFISVLRSLDLFHFGC